MPRFALLALFTALAFAQNPADLFNKPPADVDEALRARIKEFHQYHVTQEFRKAEKLVAEDSQDFFYSHNKPHYLSFEIRGITYSDNFTKARAVVLCEQYVPMPGFMDKPLQVPTPSTWKLVDGKWYWYVDKADLDKTAFGTFKAGAGAGPSGLPTSIPTTADFAMNMVKADRQSLNLKPGQSEQVTVTNGAAGYMSLSILGGAPGVEAKLDRAVLKAGEKAVVTLRAGENARSGALGIRVEQTGEMLPIQVSVESIPATSGAAKVVKADRRSVSLKTGQTEQVTIANGTAGDVSISLEGEIAGVEAKLDRTVLKAGEKAVLTMLCGRGANSGVLTVRVKNTGEVLPIQVTVM
jgi:uncharacterized cupredoxin-like copper-binding protein